MNAARAKPLIEIPVIERLVKRMLRMRDQLHIDFAKAAALPIDSHEGRLAANHCKRSAATAAVWISGKCQRALRRLRSLHGRTGFPLRLPCSGLPSPAKEQTSTSSQLRMRRKHEAAKSSGYVMV